MFRRSRYVLAVMALSLGLMGCAARTCYHGGTCSSMDVTRRIEELLPSANLTNMLPDATTLELNDPHSPRPTLSYYALTPGNCQCLAVQHSTQGNLLDGERRSVRAGGNGEDPAMGLKMDALTHAAREARNRSAAAALEIYFSLAGGEARRQLLEQARDEVQAALDNVAELRAQGLEVPFDDTAYARRLTTIDSQLIEIELALAEGNQQLLRMIGVAPDSNVRIWPQGALEVLTDPLDVEQEVQVGLGMRPQLQGIYQLTYRLNAASVDVARQLLGGVNGMLGMRPLVARHVMGMLAKADASASCEVGARRAQLMQYARDQERETADDIRQAIIAIRERLRLATLAQQLVVQWQTRLDDLAALHEIDKASFVDITLARLEWLDAQGKLADALVECQKSRVELWKAQGRLVADCDGRSCGVGRPLLSEPMMPSIPTDEESVPSPPTRQQARELPLPPVPLSAPQPPLLDPSASVEPVDTATQLVVNLEEGPPKPPQSIAQRVRRAVFPSPPLPGGSASTVQAQHAVAYEKIRK